MQIGADIGGTKTLLEARAGATRVLRRRFANRDYASFDAVLEQFLRELHELCLGSINAACFAVAGPIAGGSRATLTNLESWNLDSRALASRHGLGQVALINDFAAIAEGLDSLQAHETVTLQAGNRVVLTDGFVAAGDLVVKTGVGCD